MRAPCSRAFHKVTAVGFNVSIEFGLEIQDHAGAVLELGEQALGVKLQCVKFRRVAQGGFCVASHAGSWQDSGT